MQISSEQLDDYQLWLKKFGRSGDTAEQYAKHVRRAYEAGGPFEQLTESDLAPKTLQLTKAALKAWAEFVGDTELLSELGRVRLPPALRQSEDVPLTREEWNSLRVEVDEADYLPEPVRAELGMLVCRGFRCGDVLRLKRKEVTTALRKGVLNYKGKGNKRLNFTVADSWCGYLEILADHKDWERVEDLICPGSKPKCRTKSSGQLVARALDKCGAQVGLDLDNLHPHLLRHSYATFYYDRCRDPAKLQAHMGWNSIEVAMKYVHAGSVEELDAIADSLFDDPEDDDE